MSKIMLVEDDNNLREIYGERLAAEGYDIVAAKDGEEALAMAVKERPDLIISDVMMPKISGFDMLDILRQTPETKDVKVIMMTALSQAEDKERANSLGADKYLVKSQVTLEDVARVVANVLNGPANPPEQASEPQTTQPPTPPQPVAKTTPQNAANTSPVEPVSSLAVEPVQVPAQKQPTKPEEHTQAEQPALPQHPSTAHPVVDSTTPAPQSANTSTPVGEQKPAPNSPTLSGSAKPKTVAQELNQIKKQIENFVATKLPETTTHQEPLVQPVANQPTEPAIALPGQQQVAEPASTRKKIIEPISGQNTGLSITELYEKELAKETAEAANNIPADGDSQPITNGQPTPPTYPVTNPSQIVQQNTSPLVTADLSKIDGVTTGPVDNNPQQPVNQAQQPGDQAIPQPVASEPAPKVDPNQIAL